MLFAKPDRFYLVLRNAECRYKCFTDRIGPALALIEVVFSAAFRVSVTDDQKAVSQLNWIVQGIRHGAEDPVGYRANDRGVEIERYFNGELRKLVQLFGEWGTIDPLLVSVCMDVIECSLAKNGGIDLRLGFYTLKASRDVFSACCRRQFRIRLFPRFTFLQNF